MNTVETAFYDLPLVQQNSLKRQVVCEMRVATTCPCKVNTFLPLEFEAKGIFQTEAVMYRNGTGSKVKELTPVMAQRVITLLYEH